MKWLRIQILIFCALWATSLSGQICNSPLIFTSQEITDTSVSVRWFHLPPSPDSVQIDIVAEGQLPRENALLVVDASLNSYVIDTLKPNQKYSAYIRSICDFDTSNWNRFDFRTGIRAGDNCTLDIPILDQSCNIGGQSIDYFVRNRNQDTLGQNTRLYAVDLIIEHPYPADLKIELVAPNGNKVLLAEHEGTLSDHFGNPEDTLCSEVTRFSIYACAALEDSDPPFIGEFMPLSNFDSVNQYTGPVNGKWSLSICDRAGDDVGLLKHINLLFESSDCPVAPIIKQSTTGDTSVGVTWTSMDYDSIRIGWSGRSMPDSINDPNFQWQQFPSGIESTELFGVGPNRFAFTSSYILCDGNWYGPSCPTFLITSCDTISLKTDWENETECGECYNCGLQDPIWSIPDSSSWQIGSSNNSSMSDMFGEGLFVYRDASLATCRERSSVLESVCLERTSKDPDDTTCFIGIFAYFESTNSSPLLLLASKDEFVTVDTLAQIGPAADRWFYYFTGFPSKYQNEIFKLRIVSEPILNSFGDVAIGDILLQSIRAVPLIEQVTHPDRDQDGFGNTDSVILYCGQRLPEHLVLNSEDCSDSDSLINPLALDIPCNGIDENCDGTDDLEGAQELQILIDSIRPPSCPESMDGYLQINITGGLSPYTIRWSNGDSSNTLNQIAQGMYSVTVTDRDNCQVMDRTIEVSDPNQLSATVSILEPADCPENNMGRLQASVSGGTPPYNFNWSNNDKGAIADSLAAGSYQLTITDQSNCRLELDNLRLRSKELEATLAITKPISCYKGKDGTIRAIVTNGQAPFQYRWNTQDTTAIIDDLHKGFYAVTIEDALGCNVTIDSFFLGDPPPLTISQLMLEDISCNETNNGSIEVQANGGTPPYSYRFISPENEILNGSRIRNLSPGTYSLIVSDQAGCMLQVDSIVLNEPSPISIQSLVVNPTSCPLSSDGSIHINIAGGQGDYTFSWSDSGPSTTSRLGLRSGSYGLTVTDGLGCKEVFAPIVVQRGNQELIPQLRIIDPLECIEGDIGLLEAHAPGAQPPVAFNWSFGSQIVSPVPTDTTVLLTAGDYSLTITDQIGCVGQSEVIRIDSIAPIRLIDTILLDTLCPKESNGFIEIQASSLRPPVQYLWSNGIRNPRIGELNVGRYTLDLSDSSGCIFPTLTFDIVEFETPDIVIDTIFQATEICFSFQSHSLVDSFAWLYNGVRSVDTTFCAINTDPRLLTIEVYYGSSCIESKVVFGRTSSYSHETNEFILYPNPAQDYFMLQADNATWDQLMLFDALGKNVMNRIIQDPKRPVDIHNLPKGVYWLHLYKEGRFLSTHKLIKQ